jgi:hypothetical protein
MLMSLDCFHLHKGHREERRKRGRLQVQTDDSVLCIHICEQMLTWLLFLPCSLAASCVFSESLSLYCIIFRDHLFHLIFILWPFVSHITLHRISAESMHWCAIICWKMRPLSVIVHKMDIH